MTYANISDPLVLADYQSVLQPGAVSRRVVFPPGAWKSEDGVRFTGPCVTTVEAPLCRLPWFESCD